jgi:hypothetical protein
MTPEQQFAALGLYRDETSIITRDELIAQTMVGTLEGIVKAMKAKDQESTRTIGQFVDYMEGSIADIKALYPEVKW